MYEVAKFEGIMDKAAMKWLGVPRCLFSVVLYGKGILKLPMTSWSSNVLRPAWSTAPTEKTGKKWNPGKRFNKPLAHYSIRISLGRYRVEERGLG